MSTEEFNLDSFLDDIPVGESNPARLEPSEPGSSDYTPLFESGYEGSIDYRIRQLSYSSLTTLHNCPRKFQLYRLRTTHREEEHIKSTITFAFGHVVGDAIQAVFQGLSEQDIILRMFLGWHTDLLAEDEKGKKSFWEAVIALQRFISLCASGFLDDYELVSYNGVPACELSFSITFPDGFRFRGFVDAVLRHRISGKVIVLECKTTGLATVNPATYKNSAQAIGYSIVLDHIFPDLSSYDVLYLVYQTKGREYLTIPFTKTYLQRALWIRELLLDLEMIKLYESAGVYPMHGESCISFGRDCEYINSCTMSTGYLARPGSSADFDTTEYQVQVSIADLLDTQIQKVTPNETL